MSMELLDESFGYIGTDKIENWKKRFKRNSGHMEKTWNRGMEQSKNKCGSWGLKTRRRRENNVVERVTRHGSKHDDEEDEEERLDWRAEIHGRFTRNKPCLGIGQITAGFSRWAGKHIGKCGGQRKFKHVHKRMFKWRTFLTKNLIFNGHHCFLTDKTLPPDQSQARSEQPILSRPVSKRPGPIFAGLLPPEPVSGDSVIPVSVHPVSQSPSAILSESMPPGPSRPVSNSSRLIRPDLIPVVPSQSDSKPPNLAPRLEAIPPGPPSLALKPPGSEPLGMLPWGFIPPGPPSLVLIPPELPHPDSPESNLYPANQYLPGLIRPAPSRTVSIPPARPLSPPPPIDDSFLLNR